MHVSKEIKQRVNEKLERVIEIATERLGQEFRFPTVIYTKRGTTAGTANIRGWRINLNPVLLTENLEDFLARTVAHEMAHLIDAQVNPEGHKPKLKGYRRDGRPIYKRDIHGASWKRIMVMVGADPSRCHSYDTSNSSRRQARFTWICSVHGTEMELGPKQHKKQLKASEYGGMYTPRKTRCGSICRSKFEFNRTPVVTAPEAIAADAPTQTQPKPAAGRTKKELAGDIYRRMPGRAQFIGACMLELVMKKSTASTYHYNFKSGKWIP